jgi:hypothetical protein
MQEPSGEQFPQAEVSKEQTTIVPEELVDLPNQEATDSLAENPLSDAISIPEGSPDEPLPPEIKQEQNLARREETKEEARQKTPEQRQADIETLAEWLPDFVAQSETLAEAKESYEATLREEGAKDDEVEFELARLEANFEEMKRNSEVTLNEAVEEGTLTPKEADEKRKERDAYLTTDPEIAKANLAQDVEDKIDEEVSSGKITEEQAKEKKSELEKYLGMGLAATAEWARAGFDSTDAKTIFDLFLVFGAEGKFGTGSMNEFKSGMKEGSDLYLMEILESGDEKDVKGFFEAMLDIPDAGELTDEKLKDLIDQVYYQVQIKEWSVFNDRLSGFLNKKGKGGEHTFSEHSIKHMIEELSSKSADQVRKLLGIETTETSNEADGGAGDQVGSDDAGGDQTTVTQFPTQPNVPESKAA